MLLTIDKRGSINLPSTIRKELGLETGSYLEMEVSKGGSISLIPVSIYPSFVSMNGVWLNLKRLGKVEPEKYPMG